MSAMRVRCAVWVVLHQLNLNLKRCRVLQRCLCGWWWEQSACTTRWPLSRHRTVARFRSPDMPRLSQVDRRFLGTSLNTGPDALVCSRSVNVRWKVDILRAFTSTTTHWPMARSVQLSQCRCWNGPLVADFSCTRYSPRRKQIVDILDSPAFPPRHVLGCNSVSFHRL
jgi:hypothetical protein